MSESKILPPELEREIFELAYRLDPSDGLNLKLVAQRVRVWLEAAREKEPAFFAAVKNLSFAYPVLSTQAVEIVSLCSAVQQLACWINHDETPQLLLLIRQLPLRRLSIEHEHFVNVLAASALASSPWTLNLTHLELVFWREANDGVRFTQQLVHDLCKLPRLTHVALSLDFKDGVRQEHVDLITSGLPNLSVLIILVNADDDLAGNFSGGCVVEISEESMPDVSEVHHSEDNDLWARAERMIAARKAAASQSS
ncbi:hypothetical protein FB45DRAFT_963172 [Roridomyces roridus]|uniref:Uncharacterized protein n=1 Tax=Roridomyces roridus TaxID=1738132 RepID=A0AAD7F8J6_9AGAR|nr:hypothetical protein FB45DRAFT_963172 [Roridomyces roridus]